MSDNKNLNVLKTPKINNKRESISYIFPFKNNDFSSSSNNNNSSINDLIKTNENEKIQQITSNKNTKIFSYNIEESLNIFYRNSLIKYKNKNFDSSIKEIENNERLYYIGSINSFNILVLKIRCLFKKMKFKYNPDLTQSNVILYTKEYLSLINIEFRKLHIIIDTSNKYEYEILTEVYSDFLLHLTIFSLNKEEFCKSMVYISLGINTLKTFFLRIMACNNLKIYKIYIQLLLLLIKQLIGEYNIDDALLYIRLVLKISESALKIYTKNKNIYSKKKINKIIILIGITHLYMGICFDKKNLFYESLESYRQSFYYFFKVRNPNGICAIKNDNIHFIINNFNEENNFIKTSYLLFCQTKSQIENNIKRNNEKLIRIKKLKEENNKLNNININRKKLELISNGIYGDNSRNNNTKDKIYKMILTPKNQTIISKLDNDLISLAYSEDGMLKLNKNKNFKLKKSISSSAMENLYHYEIYNQLMTKKYRDFIMENNNLKINNPESQKDFIEKLHSYLNLRVLVQSSSSTERNKQNFLSAGNTTFSTPKNEKNINYNNVINQIYKNNSNNKNNGRNIYSARYTNNIISLNKSNSYSNTSRINLNSKMKQSKPSDFISSRNSSFRGQKTAVNKRMKNMKQSKIYLKKNNNNNSQLLSKKYFNKIIYLDQLTKKELDLQKKLLSLKKNNSKLFFDGYSKEIEMEGFDREEQYKKYLIIGEKIKQNVIKKQKEIIAGEANISNLSRRGFESLLRNAKNMDRRHGVMGYKYKEKEEIKKINEKSINILDGSINKISNDIQSKKNKLKNN